MPLLERFISARLPKISCSARRQDLSESTKLAVPSLENDSNITMDDYPAKQNFLQIRWTAFVLRFGDLPDRPRFGPVGIKSEGLFSVPRCHDHPSFDLGEYSHVRQSACSVSDSWQMPHRRARNKSHLIVL